MLIERWEVGRPYWEFDHTYTSTELLYVHAVHGTLPLCWLSEAIIETIPYLHHHIGICEWFVIIIIIIYLFNHHFYFRFFIITYQIRATFINNWIGEETQEGIILGLLCLIFIF